MKKVPLHKIFDISYGNSFDLASLEICDDSHEGKVNFVSRTRENNGVSGIVKRRVHTDPFESGLITVAGSGNSVLESFIQPAPFYTGYHVFVLTPLEHLEDEEKLFYCFCIRQNQYRYSFGRQANKTIHNLLVPETVPSWIRSLPQFAPPSPIPMSDRVIALNISKWKSFKYSDFFEIATGIGPKVKPNEFNNGITPHISTTDLNNGISYFLNDPNPPHEGNRITVSNDGSVGSAFYQPISFCSSYKVNVLNPLFELNPYIALFLVTVIRLEKFRYSYGRKWGLQRMNETTIRVPVDAKGNPNFAFMENYIKSLPFSSSI